MSVKLAMLGAEHAHVRGKLRAIHANPEVEFLGIYEANETVRQARQQDDVFAGVHWFRSQEELLAAEGLQGVIVDGLVRHNGPMARAALECGKHVLLEKPAGTDSECLADLQRLAKPLGLHIQMGYQFRYTPAFEFTQATAAQGLLGDLFSFRARISKDQASYYELLPELSHYQGGTFFELGCHILDMGIALLGAPVSVHSVLRTDYGPDPRFADNTVAVVEFGGGIGVFESSAMEVDPRRRIEIYGTHGSIIMEPMMPAKVQLCLQRASPPFHAGWQEVEVGERPLFVKDIAEFAACIRSEKAPDYSPEHDLLVQRTLIRICQPAG
ncbi:MAG: Gfo/Idh/MocA family protein [Anaerolineae bacterium]